MTAPTAARATPLPGAPGSVATALPTRQRRPGLVALAVALIVALAAVGAWLYAEAGQKTPVAWRSATSPRVR